MSRDETRLEETRPNQSGRDKRIQDKIEIEIKVDVGRDKYRYVDGDTDRGRGRSREISGI